MKLIKGPLKKATKCVLYGVEGIGKSTFAAKLPMPVFIDTEDGTNEMDVIRTPKPTSWTMLIEQVKYFKTHSQELKTLVIDTADWAERLCIEHICSKARKEGLESFGYGHGYTYLAEEFGKLLDLLTDLIDLGINVVLTAHAQMKKIEQPDELGAYDRWELKLQKKTASLVKEWASMVLFANYKTYVVNVDNKGAEKGKNKAQGGKRVMYTSHHPCWDAKNRHGLQPELDFDYEQIKHCIERQEVVYAEKKPESVTYEIKPDKDETVAVNNFTDIPKPLADLMQDNNVTVFDIQRAVASKGYYPQDTPIENYDPGFVSGVLVGAWAQVYQLIEEIKKDDPF